MGLKMVPFAPSSRKKYWFGFVWFSKAGNIKRRRNKNRAYTSMMKNIIGESLQSNLRLEHWIDGQKKPFL